MDQLAGLTDEARTLALDRFRLLQPHLEENRPLRLVAAAAGIPLRTAQHWVEKYQQFGLAALARRKRADSGEHRAVSVKIREAIEGLALQKPLARGDRAKLAAGRLEGVRLENSRLKITRKLMCNPRLEGT